MGELADVVDVLGIEWLVQTKTFHGLSVHFRIDPAFTHHDFDRVARNQTDQGEGQQGDAEESGYQQPHSAGDKTKHLGVYLISRLGVLRRVSGYELAGLFFYFTLVVVKLLLVSGLI